MSNATLTIESKVTEQQMIEFCLNMICSGYEPYLHFALHSMANNWKGDKNFYYLNLFTKTTKSEEAKNGK